MKKYTINKNDIIERIYFITKLVQNQKNGTMQGALTSKSDFMGGIFDRFINTLSDSLIFNKVILQDNAFKETNKKISVIEDFYYYKPSSKNAGIAPDIFGLNVNNKKYPFTKFDNKWIPVPSTPQIEVKTFKAKDQMISLRNQNYDDEYLVLVDLDLRIDYLVPFMDSNLFTSNILQNMGMDDTLFIVKDDRNQITKPTNIDFSNNIIGTIGLISITNAHDFMNQSTFCGPGISVRRMKEINQRKLSLKSNLSNDKLTDFSCPSSRNKKLYSFNDKWKKKFTIDDKTECLDFSADKIDSIRIVKYNKDGIILTSDINGCSFNNQVLEKGKQYSVKFETLGRSGNGGSEFFMQKQCACYLNSLEQQLINEFLKIINQKEE